MKSIHTISHRQFRNPGRNRGKSKMARADKMGEEDTIRVAAKVAIAGKVDGEGSTEAVASKVDVVNKVKEEVIRDQIEIYPPKRVDVDVTDEIETFFATNFTRRNHSAMEKTTLYSIGRWNHPKSQNR